MVLVLKSGDKDFVLKDRPSMSQCIFALQLVKCSYAKIHCGHHSCICPISIKYFLSPEDHSHDYCDPMTPKHSLFKIHFWHSTMCYSKVSHWHVEKINIVVDKTSSYLWHVKSQSLSGHCQCMRKAVENWKPPKAANHKSPWALILVVLSGVHLPCHNWVHNMLWNLASDSSL